MAPPDPIFNLTASFKSDKFAQKVNVGVGAYRDNNEKPWVLPVVKKVEKMIVSDASVDHEYLPIDGLKTFTDASAKLMLGNSSPALLENRTCAVQTLSGTGALRVGAEFLSRILPKSTVYIPNPTWAVHRTLFQDVRFKVEEYPYYDANTNGLDFKGWLSCIHKAPERSIFIVHACAHNPTGIDPSMEQWSELCDAFLSKNHFVFMDSAYQGFASGDVDLDAYAPRLFVSKGMELFIAQSFAKNFGLYNERVGCLITVSKTSQQAANIRSQICKIIRPMYSNPPAFGARIVSTILNDPTLYNEWLDQVQTMVKRIKEMRQVLFSELRSLGTPGKWDHIVSQIGMFSYTGLNAVQSKMMIEKHHIYLTDNGRISMAGLNSGNVKYFAKSMDDVVRAFHK